MAYTYATIPLTTKAYVRALGNLAAGTPDDDTLDAIIDAATDMLERDADRFFMARDYFGWHNGSSIKTMTLREWPLISVDRVSIGTFDVLNIINNDATATEAYAGITKKTTDDSAEFLRLSVLDGDNVGTVDLTLATSPTLDELAAAANAVVGSWSANVLSGYGGYRSVSLRPVGRRECYASLTTFQIPDQGLAEYITDYDYGQIVAHFNFPRGSRNVYIEYRAGYETAPPALAQICAEIALLLYRSGKIDMSLKSERLGDYAWTAATGIDVGISSDAMQFSLAPFKNNPI